MKKLLAILFLVFIFLVIFAADTDTFPPIIRDIYRFPNGDLVGHFMLYGILAFLFAWAFPRRLRLGRFHPALTSLLAAGLALAEEISQFFFPLRTPSLLDLGCGLLGILVADWLAACWGNGSRRIT
jgi:VanZ family protein